MDPYDIPDELSMLQSQDMSRIGFIQDLVRGINKLNEGARKAANIREQMPVGTLQVNYNALLDRAFLFIEDEDYEKMPYENRVW